MFEQPLKNSCRLHINMLDPNAVTPFPSVTRHSLDPKSANVLKAGFAAAREPLGPAPGTLAGAGALCMLKVDFSADLYASS